MKNRFLFLLCSVTKHRWNADDYPDKYVWCERCHVCQDDESYWPETIWEWIGRRWRQWRDRNKPIPF